METFEAPVGRVGAAKEDHGSRTFSCTNTRADNASKNVRKADDLFESIGEELLKKLAVFSEDKEISGELIKELMAHMEGAAAGVVNQEAGAGAVVKLEAGVGAVVKVEAGAALVKKAPVAAEAGQAGAPASPDVLNCATPEVTPRL